MSYPSEKYFSAKIIIFGKIFLGLRANASKLT
jgi:hypothetical protein